MARVPAPELLETAQIWWDAEAAPLVVHDDAGALFELVDGADDGNRLVLWRPEEPVGAAAPAVATALAEGLAACDFPPTGDGASPHRVAATLRVAGLGHLC
jgi:hypothetical protein